MPFVSYNFIHGKEILAPSEGFKQFDFKNPAYITVKLDTVVIMGDRFEINMFEYATHFSPGLPQPLSPLSLWNKPAKGGLK